MIDWHSRHNSRILNTKYQLIISGVKHTYDLHNIQFYDAGVFMISAQSASVTWRIDQLYHKIGKQLLTHWGLVTHICIENLTIIVSDDGLSPNRRQAITWTNDGILSIGPLGTNFCDILIKIHTFSLKKTHLKTSSAKRRPFCLGLNVLTVNNIEILLHDYDVIHHNLMR